MLLAQLTAAAGSAQTIPLLYNLDAPTPPPSLIGDIRTLIPGQGFGVGLTTGATTYSVASLTLEFIGNSLPASRPLNIQILSFGQAGSVPSPGVPLVPYGQLLNPTLSLLQTPWPGSTVFVNFTPATQILLQPNTSYVIGAWEDTTGNDDNGMLFGLSPAYTYSGDVQQPLSDRPKQYELGPFAPPPLPGEPDYPNNIWVSRGIGGGEAPVLELDVTAVPEPSTWVLLSVALAMTFVVRCRKERRGCREPILSEGSNGHKSSSLKELMRAVSSPGRDWPAQWPSKTRGPANATVCGVAVAMSGFIFDNFFLFPVCGRRRGKSRRSKSGVRGEGFFGRNRAGQP